MVPATVISTDSCPWLINNTGKLHQGSVSEQIIFSTLGSAYFMAWLFPVSQHPIQLACLGAGRESSFVCEHVRGILRGPEVTVPALEPAGQAPPRPEGPDSQARHLGSGPGCVLAPCPGLASLPALLHFCPSTTRYERPGQSCFMDGIEIGGKNHKQQHRIWSPGSF